MRPSEIKLRKRSRVLEVRFEDDQVFALPFEYLRVYSPSAEVRGHAPEQAVLQVDKQDVVVTTVEPVGRYAVRLIFDDGHNSGLFSWAYLHELGAKQEANWADYLERLRSAGYAHADHGHNTPPDASD